MREIFFDHGSRFAGIVAVALAISAGLLEVSFATLPPNTRPDLAIRGSKGGFKGENKYSKRGAGQVGVVVSRGRTLRGKFRIRWQNDSIFPDVCFFRGIKKNEDFRFKFFDLVNGRENLTSVLLRGNFRTFERVVGDPPDTYELRVKQRRKSRKRQYSGRLIAQSLGNPNYQDGVKMRIKR